MSIPIWLNSTGEKGTPRAPDHIFLLEMAAPSVAIRVWADRAPTPGGPFKSRANTADKS